MPCLRRRGKPRMEVPSKGQRERNPELESPRSTPPLWGPPRSPTAAGLLPDSKGSLTAEEPWPGGLTGSPGSKRKAHLATKEPALRVGELAALQTPGTHTPEMKSPRLPPGWGKLSHRGRGRAGMNPGDRHQAVPTPTPTPRTRTVRPLGSDAGRPSVTGEALPQPRRT